MKLKNSKQVFNMISTNGRRADVEDSYLTYLEILDEMQTNGNFKWSKFPNGFTQYNFYKEALKRSEEKFKVHTPFDNFEKMLEKSNFKKLFYEKNVDELKIQYPEWDRIRYAWLDMGIEAKARFYSGNLHNIGFVNDSRKITDVGRSLLASDTIIKDSLENIFPFTQSQLIYIRQLLKLRIYDNSGTRYYKPFYLSLLALYKGPQSVNHLEKLIPLVSPYKKMSIEKLLSLDLENEKKMAEFYMPYEKEIKFNKFDNSIIEERIFFLEFKNGKSGEIVQKYYDFYKAMFEFTKRKNNLTFDHLMAIYNKNKTDLKTAFGYDAMVFKTRGNWSLETFLEKNEGNIYLVETTKELNNNLLFHHHASTRYTQIKEYGDTLIRLLSSTGLVVRKNGIIELRNSLIWKNIFPESMLIKGVFGSNAANYTYGDYEKKYFENHSFASILDLNEEEIKQIENRLIKAFEVESIKDIRENLEYEFNKNFKSFINENFPLDKSLEIFNLFTNRNNDELISEMIFGCSLKDAGASIPTMYEYIVGIVWYHFSKKDYDIFSSLNLTTTPDFLPQTHAPGDQGDIVIDYGNEIVQIEATLMNMYNQKRGEWEPVLRHATNLTIQNSGKDVTTIFIANELDLNTINIWRAITGVPLYSSKLSTYADPAKSVIIMPLETNDLIKLCKDEVIHDNFLSEVKNDFKNQAKMFKSFNNNWKSNLLDRFSNSRT